MLIYNAMQAIHSQAYSTSLEAKRYCNAILNPLKIDIFRYFRRFVDHNFFSLNLLGDLTL